MGSHVTLLSVSDSTFPIIPAIGPGPCDEVMAKACGWRQSWLWPPALSSPTQLETSLEREEELRLEAARVTLDCHLPYEVRLREHKVSLLGKLLTSVVLLTSVHLVWLKYGRSTVQNSKLTGLFKRIHEASSK